LLPSTLAVTDRGYPLSHAAARLLLQRPSPALSGSGHLTNVYPIKDPHLHLRPLDCCSLPYLYEGSVVR